MAHRSLTTYRAAWTSPPAGELVGGNDGCRRGPVSQHRFHTLDPEPERNLHKCVSHHLGGGGMETSCCAFVTRTIQDATHARFCTRSRSKMYPSGSAIPPRTRSSQHSKGREGKVALWSYDMFTSSSDPRSKEISKGGECYCPLGGELGTIYLLKCSMLKWHTRPL